MQSPKHDPWPKEGGAAAPRSSISREASASKESSNIFERKMLDKRVCKLSGEKSDKGEKEFKSWLFDVRKVSVNDAHVHEFLDWIAESKDEVTEVLMTTQQKAEPSWDVEWLNRQVYGILSETATGT